MKRINVYQAECCDFQSTDRKEVNLHERKHKALEELSSHMDSESFCIEDIDMIIDVFEKHCLAIPRKS